MLLSTVTSVHPTWGCIPRWVITFQKAEEPLDVVSGGNHGARTGYEPFKSFLVQIEGPHHIQRGDLPNIDIGILSREIRQTTVIRAISMHKKTFHSYQEMPVEGGSPELKFSVEARRGRGWGVVINYLTEMCSGSY